MSVHKRDTAPNQKMINSKLTTSPTSMNVLGVTFAQRAGIGHYSETLMLLALPYSSLIANSHGLLKLQSQSLKPLTWLNNGLDTFQGKVKELILV